MGLFEIENNFDKRRKHSKLNQNEKPALIKWYKHQTPDEAVTILLPKILEKKPATTNEVSPV